MTRASSAVISLARSDVRSDRSRSGLPRPRRPVAGLAVRFVDCHDQSRAYDDGSRSTYPTPRRVWISRGSFVSTLRRSTDTYDSTIPVSPRKS